MKALTIAAWAKPNGIKGADGMSIVSKRIAHQNGDCYNLFSWTGQKMYARVTSKGQITSTRVLEDGKWIEKKGTTPWTWVRGQVIPNSIIDGWLEDINWKLSLRIYRQ